MNNKEKLQEATMLALQGKLIEDNNSTTYNELFNYYKNKEGYKDWYIEYTLRDLINDNIPDKQIRDLMDQHKLYSAYPLTQENWSTEQKLQLNDIISDYCEKNKETRLSLNEIKLFSSFLNKGASINKIDQLCRLFPRAGKLRVASKIMNNKELHSTFMDDNTSDEEMLELVSKLEDISQQQQKNTFNITPKVSYNARMTMQDFGGGRYKNTKHWKLIQNKLTQILTDLYKQGYEYVDSDLYISVIYNFMSSNNDSYMKLTVNLGKNNETKKIRITTNMSKEASEDNLDITIE